jgi:lanosterol synthase
MSAGVRQRGAAPKEANGHATTSQKPLQTGRTDSTRWRLRNERGVHTWHYLEDDEELRRWPLTTADKYFMGLDTVCTGGVPMT